MEINFGLTAQDYSKYRAGYPDELYQRLSKYGIGLRNQSILDLGTGTGYLARGFAKQGSCVTGVDIAEELLVAAKKLDEKDNVQCTYVKAQAEHVPFQDDEFDVVTAGQCWHWFQGKKVLKEVRRILKHEGRLVIVHLDWLPLANNIVAQTEELILAYQPAWGGGGGTGLYPDWLTQVATGGFTNIETFTFDVPIHYSQEAWRGRIRASAGIGASLTQDRVNEFDHALKKLLQKQFPKQLIIPHRVFCLVCEHHEA